MAGLQESVLRSGVLLLKLNHLHAQRARLSKYTSAPQRRPPCHFTREKEFIREKGEPSQRRGTCSPSDATASMRIARSVEVNASCDALTYGTRQTSHPSHSRAHQAEALSCGRFTTSCCLSVDASLLWLRCAEAAHGSAPAPQPRATWRSVPPHPAAPPRASHSSLRTALLSVACANEQSGTSTDRLVTWHQL